MGCKPGPPPCSYSTKSLHDMLLDRPWPPPLSAACDVPLLSRRSLMLLLAAAADGLLRVGSNAMDAMDRSSALMVGEEPSKSSFSAVPDSGGDGDARPLPPSAGCCARSAP